MDDGAILGCFPVAHEKPERLRTRTRTHTQRPHAVALTAVAEGYDCRIRG